MELIIDCCKGTDFLSAVQIFAQENSYSLFIYSHVQEGFWLKTDAEWGGSMLILYYILYYNIIYNIILSQRKTQKPSCTCE